MHYICHPRRARGPRCPWELERGFRLRIVKRDLLLLFLGGETVAEGEPVCTGVQSGEELLVVIPATLGPDERQLESALSYISAAGLEPQAVLILSDPQQMNMPEHKVLPKLKLVVKRFDSFFLVVWVLQEMPPVVEELDFFNVEQVLHQLGRISRRLARRVSWRSKLPW